MRTKNLPLWLGGLFLFLPAAAQLAGMEKDPGPLPVELVQPVFDSQLTGSPHGVTIRRDAATIQLIEGRIGFGQAVALDPNGERRVFAAAFKGTGKLMFEPALPMEKQQLTLHSKAPALESEFSQAVFLFSDESFQEFSQQMELGAGRADDLQGLYIERSKKRRERGVDWEPRLMKSLLSSDPGRHAFLVADLNTRRHGWLSLIFDQADPEQLELVRWEQDWRSRNIWSKFPKGGRKPQEVFQDPLSHQEYLMQSYTLDVTVEKNTTVRVEAGVDLRLKHEGERVLLFTMDPNLRVSSVITSDGQALEFFQPRNPGQEPFSGSYLGVISPTPFAKGPVQLRFRYSGKEIVRKVGAGNYFCQSFGWYPSYGLGRVSLNANAFAGRSDFDLTLRVPKQFQAVAVGHLIESSKDKKYQTTRWKSEIPMAVAGFAFGQYKVHVEKVGEIEVQVYANKQPDEFMRSIEIQTQGGFNNVGGRNVALGSLTPSSMVKPMAAEVANNLRLMEQYFGPYPYKKLAVSNIPYAYGQGWPSLLYISALSFLDSTQRNQLGLRDHVGITDFFRAHETSHQWWGHAVGWKSYHDQWLSEGFAQFSGNLYTLFRRSPKEYRNRLEKDREILLVKDRGGVQYDQIGPIYAGLRLSSSKHPGGYSRLVYNKGGWVLHMIRMMLYDGRNAEAPDARFIEMMHDFTATYHNQPASTDDFKKVVEKHMTSSMNLDGNGSMDWFFDSWVYGTGIPRYKLDYQIEPAEQEGKFVLSGILHQSEVPDGFRMIVPLYLHLGKQSMRVGWLRAASPRTPFKIPLDFKIDKATICDWKDVLHR